MAAAREQAMHINAAAATTTCVFFANYSRARCCARRAAHAHARRRARDGGCGRQHSSGVRLVISIRSGCVDGWMCVFCSRRAAWRTAGPSTLACVTALAPRSTPEHSN
jgi:hypothetical protein